MELIEILRIFLGFILVLFLPGFAWTYVFFDKDELNVIERIALSFGISIASVPLVIFLLNKYLGLKINAYLSFITIIVMLIIPIIIIFSKKVK